MANVKYRDIPHKTPAPGVELPAFIVSEYDGGDMLLYSHGGFDIWCVYHAVQQSGGFRRARTRGAVYPLKLDRIKVEEMTGTIVVMAATVWLVGSKRTGINKVCI